MNSLYNSSDIKHIFINESVDNQLDEGMKDIIKKAWHHGKKAALTGAAAGALMAAAGTMAPSEIDNNTSEETPTTNYYSNTDRGPTPPDENDPFGQRNFNQYYNKALEPKVATEIPKPIQQPEPEVAYKTPLIDVDIISNIESGGRAYAKNSKGARGICQLKRDAWNEAVRSLYGKNWKKYEYNTNWYKADINKKVASHYYNVILPKHLEEFNIPVTTETLLAAYNYGSTNVKNTIRKHGRRWIDHLPTETKNYINSYINLLNLNT